MVKKKGRFGRVKRCCMVVVKLQRSCFCSDDLEGGEDDEEEDGLTKVLIYRLDVRKVQNGMTNNNIGVFWDVDGEPGYVLGANEEDLFCCKVLI